MVSSTNAGEVGLAGAGRPGDEHVVVFDDAAAGRELAADRAPCGAKIRSIVLVARWLW